MAELKQEYILKAKYEGQGEVGKFRSDLQALGKVEALRTLGKDVRDLTVRFNESKAKLVEQARVMRQTDTVSKEMVRSYESAQREVGKLAAALDKKKQAFRTSTAAAKDAGINTRALGTEEKRLAASAEATGKVWAARRALGVRSHKDIRDEVSRLQLAYNDLKGSGVASALEILQAKQRLKAKTLELTTATNVWASSFDRVRNGAIALAGVGYSLVKTFQEFSSFESGMGEVYTLVDLSTEKFKEFKAETKDVVGNLPQESRDLTKALYDIISAGVQLEDSNKVLELSAKAASAGVTDTKTAVNIGIGAMNAYGKSVDDLGWICDVLFQTVKYGVTTFPELAQSMGDVLPTARSAEIGLIDVSAAIATLTKAGIKTPQAATAMKGAIRAMAAPTPEAKKQFDALGITWDGLLPTLEAIAEKGLSLEQMRMLIPDAEAMTGVLSLTQNLDVFRETLASMDNAGGSMEAAYQKMADTPDHEIKMLMKSLGDLGKSVGELASKVIIPAAIVIGGFVDVINDSPAAIQYMVAAIGAAITAGALWKIGLSEIVAGIWLVISKAKSSAAGIAIMNGAVGMARKGMIALTATMAANPIMAGMTALVLAAGAAWLLFGKDSLEASRKHGETAKSIGASRKAVDGEISSLEKLQKALRDTAPGSEAHLKAERELARLLPSANLDLDEQGRIIARVGDAADENAKKLQQYIDLLKEESRTQLALQLEQQFKSYQKAGQAVDEYKQKIKNLYGIGEDQVSSRQRLNKALEEAVGQYDRNMQKGSELRTNLTEQKKAWEDLLQTMSNAGLSADDLAIALDNAHVSAELKKSILNDYAKLGSAIESTGTDAEKAAAKQREAFAAAADAIKQEYLDLAAKIKSTLDEISRRNQSFQAEVRAMAREGMSDVGAWDDLKKEADEYAEAARKAIYAGNFDEAVRLADEAKSKYRELNKEVKDGEKVVLSESEARETSIELMRKANDIAIEALQSRAKADEEAAKNLEEQIGDFKTGWHDAFAAFLHDGKAAIKDLEKQLDAVTKARTIPITIKSSEAHQSGGIIGLRMATGGAVAFRNMLSGGNFPGFGGGDRRHVIAEDGEYMFDKFRVKDAGLDVVREFHRGNYSYVVVELLKRLRGGLAMRFGGMVDNIQAVTRGPQMMAAGGSVVGSGANGGGTLRHEHNLRTADGRQATVYTDDLNADRLIGILRRAEVMSS